MSRTIRTSETAANLVPHANLTWDRAESAILARDVVDAWRYGAGDLATLPTMMSDPDARAVVTCAASRARSEGHASLTVADAAAYVMNAAHDALPGDDTAVAAWLDGADTFILTLATVHAVAMLASVYDVAYRD